MSDLVTAYVVSAQKPLILVLDLYIDDDLRERYEKRGCTYSNYIFASEELPPERHIRKAYICRINRVSLSSGGAKKVISETKAFASKSMGWLGVRLCGVDPLNRILVDVYDLKDRENLADVLLETEEDGRRIAEEYSKPKMAADIDSGEVEDIAYRLPVD